MANTQPVNDDPATTDYILDRARQDSPARVYPVAAATRGSKGEVMTEMAALVAAGAVAFSDDGKTIMDSGVMRRVLEYSTLVGVPVITHAEDRTLVRRRRAERGRRSRRGSGCPATPRIAEEVHVARDLDARASSPARTCTSRTSRRAAGRRADPARARARRPRHGGGRAAPPDAHRRGRARLRHEREGRAAAALGRRSRRVPRGRSPTARSTRSPPTTRRTRSTRRSSTSPRRRPA